MHVSEAVAYTCNASRFLYIGIHIINIDTEAFCQTSWLLSKAKLIGFRYSAAHQTSAERRPELLFVTEMLYYTPRLRAAL